MSRSHEPLHILLYRNWLKKLLNGQVLCWTKNPAAGDKYTFNHGRLMMIPQPLTWVEQGGERKKMLLTFYFFLGEARTAQAPVLLKHLLKSAGALSAVGQPWDLHQPQGQEEGPAAVKVKWEKDHDSHSTTIKKLICFV